MNGEFVVFGQVRQFNTGAVNDFGEVQGVPLSLTESMEW